MEADGSIRNSTTVSHGQPVSPRSSTLYEPFLQSKDYAPLQYTQCTPESGFPVAYGNATASSKEEKLISAEQLEDGIEGGGGGGGGGERKRESSVGDDWRGSLSDLSIQQMSCSPNEATLRSSFDGVVGVVEDKERRRRNTLASARFRQRRKAKEQYLEQTVQEYEKKIKQLEQRIYELELETKWFKDLIRPVRVGDVGNARTKPSI
ncbi:uncharacterized protein SOCG_01897 [Schizosaccharomyces octosporus yFS286]|uniref:BZIP domain-containing protein n=1 Tax=Schizosaccharomyces octosporus (strain yFS286) TaxID=483514 RepID=S9PUM7_SCHOY|nr:uncharacterized protein SOCG_01897 [Schizosaccharomyces octosporus yFS286]EPX71682.1 hypothetical protein SOCG_01897 [Schizosaccharomyces octosporus yFS286]